MMAIIDYTSYKYLYPPRPEQKIPPTLLGFYENRGWYAQKKKNGTNTVIFSNGKEVIFKTRHNDDHKLWSPLTEHREFFSGREKWNVYCAELLHSKVTGGPKHELFIHDIIVSDGHFLRDFTFADRQKILHTRFIGKDEGDQIRVHQYVTIANCYTKSFKDLFANLKPEDEGLVLKDPKAKLQPCYKANSNSKSQVKVRIPARNYSF